MSSGGHGFVSDFILSLQCCSLVREDVSVCVCVCVCVLILAIMVLLEVVRPLNIVGFFSDHGITGGSMYPGDKLPFKIGIQTKKKENQQIPQFLLVSEYLIQM